MLICPGFDNHRFAGISTRGSDLHRDRHSFFSEYLYLLQTPVTSADVTPKPQAVRAASDTQNMLTNMFEKIENFFRRLETYIEVPPTTGMTDIIVKIMIELLSILAIATKESNRGKASESISGGMNCFRQIKSIQKNMSRSLWGELIWRMRWVNWTSLLKRKFEWRRHRV
jgi:hypothetical protein